MSDSWATAFNLSYLNAGSSVDSAARLVALAGQRQAERQLQAVLANEDYLIEQNAVLCHDLNRFVAYGQEVAAQNQALREYVDRLAQEVASLRENEGRFLQEAANLRDYNDRLCQENAAWRRYIDQLEQENTNLKTELDDLLEEDGETD